MNQHKISFRFYKDHEVRAIWNDENDEWLFSAIDIIGAINNESNYKKAGNYWRWLKRKLKSNNIQFVSGTHKLKITANDGKKYNSDVLSSKDVITIAKSISNKKSMDFLDWFIYSENTIDGKSKKKAYQLFESGNIEKFKPGTIKCLQQIHAYIFGGLYDFAGKIRTKNISKGSFTFCLAKYLDKTLKDIENMPQATFDEILDKYVEMNVAYPFM